MPKTTDSYTALKEAVFLKKGGDFMEILNGTRIDDVLKERMKAAGWESAGPQDIARPGIGPDTGIGLRAIKNSQFPERVGRIRSGVQGGSVDPSTRSLEEMEMAGRPEGK